jgi:inhibitor of cysteine peptidase
VDWLRVVLIGTAIFTVACNPGNNGSSEDYPSEVQITYADKGTTVKLARSGSLIVALPSNPSTGFSWFISDSASSNFEVVGEPRFVPPGSTSPVVGAPGTEVFTLKPSRSGTSELVMEYKRRFEPIVPPEDVFRLTVEIQ